MGKGVERETAGLICRWVSQLEGHIAVAELVKREREQHGRDEINGIL